ncbi:MAG TPA: hypothetical protein VF669_11170 [Tepidisphaeraceae bacterium]|jgi:hypothetical protein
MLFRTTVTALATLLVLPLVTLADRYTYTIDQSQSFLSVGGNLTGNFATAQTNGSTSTSYTGTIQLDRTGNILQFNAGSALNAVNLGTKQQPFTDGSPGSAFANYGRTADGPFFSTTLEALRGFQLDLESDPFTINGTSFSSGSGNLALVVKSGSSDFSYGNTPGEFNFSGKGTANGAVTNSTLTTASGVETLTLYISTGSILYTAASTNDSSLTFGGQIVATRAVPEPALAGVVVGLLLLGARKRR